MIAVPFALQQIGPDPTPQGSRAIRSLGTHRASFGFAGMCGEDEFDGTGYSGPAGLFGGKAGGHIVVSMAAADRIRRIGMGVFFFFPVPGALGRGWRLPAKLERFEKYG